VAALNAIRKLLSLDRGERSLLLQALARVAMVRAALWLLPFRVVHAGVAARARRVSASPAKQPVARIVWAIDAASRRVPRATCLTRAFAGTLLLAAHGHAAAPRLGVARDGDGIRAHAWIECGGETLFAEPGTDAFVALPPLTPR